MAEFGIAAGVLQVASFGAEVGSTLWRIARDIRSAVRDIDTLAREVQSTSTVLRNVGTMLNQPGTKALHTPEMHSDTRNVLTGCQSVFNELDAAANAVSGKSTPGIMIRLKWPLGKGRIVELRTVLERYRDVLHLMLTVLQIMETRRAV